MRTWKSLIAFVVIVMPLGAGQILYDSGSPPQGSGPGLFSDEWVAQAVTASDNWQMGSLGIFAGGTQPITIILAQDNAGLPGTVISSWTIDKTDWDPGGGWGYTDATFTFAAGQSYWFEYTSTADFFDGDFLPIPAPSGNPDLAFSFDAGADWVIASGAGPVGLQILAPVATSTPEPRSVILFLLSVWPSLLIKRKKKALATQRGEDVRQQDT